MVQRKKAFGVRDLLLRIVILASFAVFIFALPGTALAGGIAEVNLTWDSIYGYGYEQGAPVQVTITDPSGAIRGTAETVATYYGDFAILFEDIIPAGDSAVDIKSGDTIIIAAGDETDTISPKLSAYTSATLNKVFIESNPGTTIIVYIDGNVDGNYEYRTATEEGGGKYYYQSTSEITPYDYLSVYYEDGGGNYIIVDPVAPYGMVSITDDVVWGFFYQPDTTATVQVLSGTNILATREIKTDSDGDFMTESFLPETDIKSGHTIRITAGEEVNSFNANLKAEVDFTNHVVTGKTMPASYVIVHVEPIENPSNYTDTTTTANSTGDFSVNANPGLDDRIWVGALHSNGNITQLEVVYGTSSRSLTQPVVYAGKLGQIAGNIEIKETRPDSLLSTETANQVTLKILTDGVTFETTPSAAALGVKLTDLNASLSQDLKTATWYVYESSTSTAGNIILKDISYNIDTDTAVGSIRVEIAGNSGVTPSVVSNARVQDKNATLSISGNILDADTGLGIAGARIQLLKGDGIIASIKTSPSGTYAFSGLSAGTYKVLIARIGYGVAGESIEITDDNAIDFELQKTDIGVMVPENGAAATFEQIEMILSNLGYDVSVINEQDISSAQTLKDNIKSLFINSSTIEFDSAKISAIKDFVSSGGSLYTSDISYALIEQAFPGKVEFYIDNPRVNTSQSIDAVIKDKGLADYVNPAAPPSTMNLSFIDEMVPWVAIDTVVAGVDVYVSGDISIAGSNAEILTDKPLAIAFREGQGRVIYTSYYACPWSQGDDAGGQRLLEYLVLSTLAGREIDNAKAALISGGYAVEKVNVGMFSTEDTPTSTSYGVDIASEKDIAFRLGWRSGAVKLTAQQPDHSLRENNGSTSPITLAVENAQEGLWGYSVTAVDVPAQGYPYVVAVGVKNTTPHDEDNGGDGSDGGAGDDDTPPASGNNPPAGGGLSPLPTAPAKPTGLKANQGADSIELSWDASLEQDVEGYNIYRSESPSDEATLLNTSAIKENTFKDSTAALNKTYYYWVTAVNNAGKESARSEMVSAARVAVLPTVTFSDVPAGAWYKYFLNALVKAHLIGGYPDGTFKPQNNITRAEFAKIVVSAIGQTPVEGAQSSFKDCANHWARGYIEKAKALNILGGYPDGSFKPNSHITRAEMSKMICLVKGLDTSSASGFSDCKGHWADTYIAAARKAGYVLGYDSTTFKPDAFATRAEVCKIIYLMIDEE